MPGRGSYRVRRGGSWYNGAKYMRAANRGFGVRKQTDFSNAPGGSGHYLGFRCIRPVPVNSSGRVRRGGGWSYYAGNMRAADRYVYSPGYSSGYLGFRCARPALHVC